MLGRLEVIRSLRTHDIRAARKAVLRMSERLDELFAKIRSGERLLSQQDRKLLADHFVESRTKKLLLEAEEDYEDRTVEGIEWEAFHAREFRKEVLEDIKYSRLNGVKPYVNDLLRSYDTSLDESTAAYKNLCRAALKGLAEFYINAEIIVRGDFDNPRLDFDGTELVTESNEQVLDSSIQLAFSNVISKYVKDQENVWSEKQHNSQIAKLDYFLSFLSESKKRRGEELTLDSITTSDARKYKEHLQEAPANAKKIYPSFSPRQAVKAAKEEGKATLSQTTINNYLQSLSSLYRFASDELEYGGKNPFKGRSNTKAAKKRQRDQRNSFSKEHLKALFSSPVYTGCKSLSSCHLTGAHIPKNSHKYWVPLIGLYSGMRLQEILQLYVEDIYQKEGIWVFDLNTNHEDKSLKTPQSKRLVPIHFKLIELGFLDLVAEKRDRDKSKRLFDDAKLASDNTYSSVFSKWFSRYMRNIGIKTNKTSFHSLRHNMKDYFRDVGESDELAENFVGRSTGSTGESYGSGFSLRRMHEALHKIDFNV
jgi:integrase